MCIGSPEAIKTLVTYIEKESAYGGSKVILRELGGVSWGVIVKKGRFAGDV
jgi:hypothetical protein